MISSKSILSVSCILMFEGALAYTEDFYSFGFGNLALLLSLAVYLQHHPVNYPNFFRCRQSPIEPSPEEEVKLNISL